jgi:hypothetical protein
VRKHLTEVCGDLYCSHSPAVICSVVDRYSRLRYRVNKIILDKSLKMCYHRLTSSKHTITESGQPPSGVVIIANGSERGIKRR